MLPIQRKRNRDSEEWTTNSVEATLLYFISPAEHGNVAEILSGKGCDNLGCQPFFTYPFFDKGKDDEGDDYNESASSVSSTAEILYGFKDLSIKVVYSTRSFRFLINVKYSEKKAFSNEMNEIVLPLLSNTFGSDRESCMLAKDKEWTLDSELFVAWLKEESEGSFGIDYSSFSTSVQSYPGKQAELRKFRLEEAPEVWLKVHNRMEILMYFFIEGASTILPTEDEEADPAWTTLLMISPETNDILGICTLFDFFQFPVKDDAGNLLDRKRLRLSQMLIVPPYQKKGLGWSIYEYVYNEMVLKDPAVVDFCVEDPTEEFTNLRMTYDLQYLFTCATGPGYEARKLLMPFFEAVKASSEKAEQRAQFPSISNSDEMQEARSLLKLSKNEFIAVCEMFMLFKIKVESKKLKSASKNNFLLKEFRFWVKKRIYKKNEDVLENMKTEAIEQGIDGDELVKQKVDETYQNLLVNDYERIIDCLRIK